MAKAFTLGDYLKPEAGVSNSGTMEQLRYIPLDQIDPDPNNFYSLEGLDELAANIELIGLQQPLRVRPTPSVGSADSSLREGAKEMRWTVVSGHRRRAACLLIRDGGSHMFDQGVPCLVDYVEASSEMRELRLIYANSSTRVLSSAEQSKQAERVTELLYKLQEQGVVFPGRMRDHVAEACNLSKSKIGRLHAIRSNLDKPLLKMFDGSEINESVAYSLSQQPVETQRRICDAWTTRGRRVTNMTANFVNDYAETLERLCKMKCKINKGGQCINQGGLLDKIFDDSFSYKPCKYDGKCCANCSEYLNCRDRCPLMDEKAKAERAKRKEARKDELAQEKAEKESAVRLVEQVWARYAQALRLADTTDRNLRARLRGTDKTYNPFNMYMPDKQIEALLDYSATDTKPSTALPFFYSFKADDAEKLVRFADALNVSLDYLFLRSEHPERAEEILNNLPQAELCEAGPRFNEGEPTAEGRYYCRIDMGDGGVHEAVGEYRGGSWSVFGGPLYEKMTVVGWWPLPERQI